MSIIRRWNIIAAFLGVFFAGVICAASTHAWFKGQDGRRLSFADRTIRRFEQQLELTPAQTERIRLIVIRTDEVRRQMRRDGVHKITGVFDRMHDEVAAELLPEQRMKLETIRTEWRTRAARLQSRTNK